jgi:simple sugar transport system substrate-binding protein
MRLHHIRTLAGFLALIVGLSACGAGGGSGGGAASGVAGSKTPKTYRDLVVGFSQLGAENDWRTANTISIQETAQDLGVKLVFADAQQKQENQIKAIRSFIAQKVDVIGVAPVVEDGWEEVFKEAKAAGIPIILVDRHAKVSDDLFATWLGSDFALEGENACKEMARVLGGKGNVVEMEGTTGSAPAIDRKAGFHACLKQYPDIKVLDSRTGDFTRAKGKAVMEGFLKQYGKDIGALYAHNDDMAIGAIQAIEAAGLKPGVDIKIVSVDAVREAFEMMAAGKINATVECNPLLGPQFFEAALKVANSEPIDKRTRSKEGVFRQDTAAQELPKRKY